MSTNPPTPDNLPPRGRPNLSNLNRDYTEIDLWELDSEDSPAKPDNIPVEPSTSYSVPSKRGSQSPIQSRNPEKQPSDVSRPPRKKEILEKPEGILEAEIDTTQIAKKSNRTDPKYAPAKSAIENLDDIDPDEPDFLNETTSTPVNKTLSPEPSTAKNSSETPASSPLKLPGTKLSKTETIGLLSLAAVLLIATILTLIHFANRVPTESPLAKDLKLPLKGERVTATSVETFWRAPLPGETSRRGTVLVPVLNVTLEGGPAAVRIFFRNQDGSVVGDSVTRQINGKTPLVIPATAGFDDLGMHAAYRTGDSRPWIIQIFEAPTATSSINEFKKLLEADISTDLQ